MLVKCALPYATGISESVLSSFSSFSSSIKQTQNNDLQACHCTVLPTYVDIPLSEKPNFTPLTISSSDLSLLMLYVQREFYLCVHLLQAQYLSHINYLKVCLIITDHL